MIMSYNLFSQVYDEIMDHNLYDEWFNFTKPYLSNQNIRILDLGCGTGTFALMLASQGYDVVGLDISEDMLMIATQKSFDLNLPVQFVLGDMLDLSEVGKYHVITCYADAICYMKNSQEVQQVFDTVYQALESQGYFIFDVHSIYQVEEVFPMVNYHYLTEDIAFLWESQAGDAEYSIEHLLTFFVKEHESLDRFERYDDIHYERTYTLDHYKMMLENSGFQEISVYADFQKKLPEQDTQRWFFVCRK